MGRPKGTKNGQRAIAPKACERCGKIRYYDKPSIAKKRRFCSYDCSVKPLPVNTCEQCGKPYPVYSDSSDRFCSRPCHSEYASQCPDKATLCGLYIDQRLTTRRIGKVLGVCHITIRRWLDKRGIPVRPSHNGLLNRGQTEPTKEQLYNLIHVKHKSYREVAVTFGVDPSAIQHWLIRHNIPRPNAWITRRKGLQPVLPSAEELRHHYLTGLSLREIGRLHGVSETPIRDLCRKHKIHTVPSGFGGRRIVGKDGHAVRSTYERAVCDWLNSQNIKHEYEPQLPFDKKSRADFLVSGVYIEIWGMNHENYKRRKATKQAGYVAHDLPLIELCCHNFSKGRDNWRELLTKELLEADGKAFSRGITVTCHAP